MSEKCEIKDCSNPGTRLTSTETKYIQICESHWHEKYRK